MPYVITVYLFFLLKIYQEAYYMSRIFLFYRQVMHWFLATSFSFQGSLLFKVIFGDCKLSLPLAVIFGLNTVRYSEINGFLFYLI